MITVESDLGTISFSKAVIGRMITEAVDSYNGKVIISNHRGKVPGKVPEFVSKIGGMDESSPMDITLTESGLDIKLFVVLRFGTSITQVTNYLVDEIYTKVKAMTGMEPNSVAVVVTGMISKNIAPRHIEVTR